RQALSPDNIRENFQLTDDGIVPVNRSGKRGAGFDPATDIVGSSIAVVLDGTLTHAMQFMQPLMMGPFFTAHKGFLMHESGGVTRIALISEHPFQSASAVQPGSPAHEDREEELLLAY